MIRLQNLDIGYRGKAVKAVFKNLNASFNAGELVGLTGDNGIGKSTLLKTITGTLQPLSGSVMLNNKSIYNYTPHQLAQHLSVVVTERTAGFNLSVKDVVASGRTPYITIFAKLTEADEAIIDQSLELLGILPLKHQLMDELSDGQRQKAMIAKSLAQQTQVIVLDEPTAFLDYTSRHLLFSTLKNLCETQNKLIIVSSHDLDMMKHYVTKTLDLFAEGTYTINTSIK